ncbi:hypothetical protein CDD83_9958 [Cordyceps sp. RAO-2017]|nr:hypothetical protein CDD83_9958 [Cordyceps sp. RAO-2017]
MVSHDSNWTRLVFRLSEIPSHVTTRDELANLLANAPDGSPACGSVAIYSLATTLIPWEHPPSRVATLMFTEVPALLASSGPDQNEWLINVAAANEVHTLKLDRHFWGMTPLNDVPDEHHLADCVAISGLASHAFGSWQPRGEDKTFMWIRDQVPREIPGIRAILYGYDTSLSGCKSFQGIEDLAMMLIKQLKANGADESVKPLVFLAHSLGGIVLKDAICKLANSEENVLERRMLLRLKGVIMFGVPNLGMEQKHLLTLVGDSHAKNMIHDLSIRSGRSGYLDRLEQSLSGIAHLEHMRFFWAFEMKMSPTFDARTTKMTGPPAILVDPASATAHRVTSNLEVVTPIQGNHSTMVKFTRADHRTGPIIRELRGFCDLGSKARDGHEEFKPPWQVVQHVAEDAALETNSTIHGSNKLKERLKSVLKSLDFPERDLRQAQIQDRFEDTFEWILDCEPFTSWLLGDEGIFWINGKPGSGKSTLMKFILTDRRIQDYGHDFAGGAHEIAASFFFNYRGTAMQKSFVGLMQNVLCQLLKHLKSCGAWSIVGQLFAKLPYLAQSKMAPWTKPRLEEALRVILGQDRAHLSISFFFDALDEFDGPPEYILRFVQYLTDRPSGSLTRTKVCFSSRPWDVFTERFDGGPSLNVEESTPSDIRYYCTSSLALALNNSAFVQPLADEIAGRASGVFLWASLIIKEISEAFRQSEDPSLDMLLGLLDLLPTELGEYYDYILQRLPGNLRLQTYALLEAIIRARWPHELQVSYLYNTTLLSYCQTYPECERAIGQTYWVVPDKYMAEAKRQVLRWGGGLVSLVPHDRDNYGLSAQLIHQTVYDFVVRLDFRDRLLSKALRTVTENGHSFHFKSFLVHGATRPEKANWSDCDDSLIHGAEAEKTTGQRWGRFLNSFPPRLIKALGEDLATEHEDNGISLGRPVEMSSPFGLAVYFGLRLYLQDQIEQKPKWFESAKCSDKLLTLIAFHIVVSYGYPSMETLLEMAELILSHGYEVSSEPLLFPYLQLNGRFWKILVEPIEVEISQALDRLCLLLLQHGQPANKTVRLEAWSGKPIHFASTLTAIWLLDHGVDVNALDCSGRTPLDCALLYGDARLASIMGLPRKLMRGQLDDRASLELTRILLGRGGRASQTAAAEWETVRRRLLNVCPEASGLPHRLPMLARPPARWPKLFLAKLRRQVRGG